jgi:hypothetical protein
MAQFLSNDEHPAAYACQNVQVRLGRRQLAMVQEGGSRS